jgi:hypothetical protein
MNLIQKKIFKGKQIITLNGDQLDIQHSSLGSKSEWSLNLSDLNPSTRHLKRIALGAWIFTGVFVIGFLLSLFGIFQAAEGSDAQAVAWTFIFLSLIPMALCLYKAITESYDWIILDYKNGQAAVYLYSSSKNKNEMDRFTEHLKTQILQHSKNEKKESIRRAIEFLKEQDVLDGNQVKEILNRLDKSQPTPTEG